MTGRDLNKLRVEPDAGDDVEYVSAHTNLGSIRKKFDQVRKDTQLC